MRRHAITFDTDWAPDIAIDRTAELLVAAGVKATWFITHQSPAIERLRADPDLFEIGIHPNFLEGSSHGAVPAAVLDHCMRLAPNAVSMRTHAMHQSTPLLDLTLRTTPIRCDVSLLLSHAKWLEPVELQWGGKTMLRIPYAWEDDVEMLRDRPDWEMSYLSEDRLHVMDFHPIHVFLNSCDMTNYTQLKSLGPLSKVSAEDMARCVNSGQGSQTALRKAIEHARASGGGLQIRDLYEAWRRENAPR